MKKLKNPDEKLTWKGNFSLFVSFFLPLLVSCFCGVGREERTNQPLKERNKVCGILHLTTTKAVLNAYYRLKALAENAEA